MIARTLLAFLTWTVFIGCSPKNEDWNSYVTDVTSASSPMTADLNEDGILDIIMGAGSDEWNTTEFGVIAINGATGNQLWHSPARNQIVGSAIFQDITGDGTPDVFIGGRSAELQALDGKTGIKIWEFYSKPGKMVSRKDGWYNFYNGQFVADQDGDGFRDLLISNGGDSAIPRGMKYRPPGKLMLLSTKTGKVLAQDFMPDRQETYFSPILMNPLSKNPEIIFGSGGESKPGHLYLCRLSDLLNKNLKASKILDSTTFKGYEAPPVLADFTRDGIKDILFNTNEAGIKLLDGTTHELIWAVFNENAEVFSQPAVGYFTGNDSIPDVFVQIAIGEYPVYSSTKQLLIDGSTGHIVKEWTGKRFTYSSPLVADLDGDGVDEVILNSVKDSIINEKPKPFFELTTYNFATHNVGYLAERIDGACFASTPWLGDLDGDQNLDILFSGSPATSSEFPGSTIFEKPQRYLGIYRRKLNIPVSRVKWGAYMGHEGRSHWNH